MQDALRDEVIARGRVEGMELVAASSAPSAARLEVALTRVGTEGSGIDPPLTLVMDARARILDADDGAELFAADYQHRGESRTLAGWSSELGAPLVGALAAGYRDLGARIFETVFRLYPFPDRSIHRSGLFGRTFGLAPDEAYIAPWFEWVEVEGVRPTLRWQSFPRASDSAAQPSEMARVKRVRYDLIVARERDSAPGDVVYRRTGLPRTEHRLEEPLERMTRYFWTVRARFELDGRMQLTEWSAADPDPAPSGDAPPPTAFRIRTR
jgi:hypothetical protein